MPWRFGRRSPVAEAVSDAAAATRIVDKEMSISHADFLRILTGARLPGEIHVDGSRITVIDNDRHLEITLSPERRRKLGLLDFLPFAEVER